MGGGTPLPTPSLWQGNSHDVFPHRLWQNKFHCWCRASEGARLNLTVPVLSWPSLLQARAFCRQGTLSLLSDKTLPTL